LILSKTWIPSVHHCPPFQQPFRRVDSWHNLGAILASANAVGRTGELGSAFLVLRFAFFFSVMKEVSDMPYKDPEKRRAYQREYKRAQHRGGRRTRCQTSIPVKFRIRTARHVLDLLEEQINVVRDVDTDAVVKARCIGYLAVTALKAIETVDLAERLEKVEAAVAGFDNGGNAI